MPLASWTTASWTSWWARWAGAARPGVARCYCTSGCWAWATRPMTACAPRSSASARSTARWAPWLARCAVASGHRSCMYAACCLVINVSTRRQPCTHTERVWNPAVCAVRLRVSPHWHRGAAQALSALNIYDWMRARVREGGAGLSPTVFTYTAAMRAALSAGLVDRALQVRAHSERGVPVCGHACCMGLAEYLHAAWGLALYSHVPHV